MSRQQQNQGDSAQQHLETDPNQIGEEECASNNEGIVVSSAPPNNLKLDNDLSIPSLSNVKINAISTMPQLTERDHRRKKGSKALLEKNLCFTSQKLGYSTQRGSPIKQQSAQTGNYSSLEGPDKIMMR